LGIKRPLHLVKKMIYSDIQCEEKNKILELSKIRLSF
jgi:hypothetical protein